jgi:hypothetical protein
MAAVEKAGQVEGHVIFFKTDRTRPCLAPTHLVLLHWRWSEVNFRTILCVFVILERFAAGVF